MQVLQKVQAMLEFLKVTNPTVDLPFSYFLPHTIFLLNFAD